MLLFKVEKLERILSRMDIPKDRRIVTPTNAFWLLGNIDMKNDNHPEIDDARRILKDIVYR